MNKQKLPRFESVSYNLLTFQLTGRYVAVFAEVAEDGLSDLVTLQLQAIGLAEETTRYFVGERGASHWHQETREPQIRNELVGLYLDDGYWHIANESDNFAGLMEAGGDVFKSTGCLKGMYCKFRHPPDSDV